MYNYRVEIFSRITRMITGEYGLTLGGALELVATTIQEGRSATSVRITALTGEDRQEIEVLRAERNDDGTWHHV